MYIVYIRGRPCAQIVSVRGRVENEESSNHNRACICGSTVPVC